MKFEDDGYIVNTRKFGEKSLIITVITENHGKISGFAKNVISKKTTGIYQIGNKIKIDYYSRVDENLGSIKCDLINPLSVNFLSDAKKLNILGSFCSLINLCIPEQEKLEDFYKFSENILNHLAVNKDFPKIYCLWELSLLDYLGLSIDLSSCAATGVVEDLIYISPKSARAVSREAGLPYKTKLFNLPKFYLDEDSSYENQDILDSLQICETFLKKNFFETHNLKFPAIRDRLADLFI